MTKVGFVTEDVSAPGIYRGMDAYAGYLLPLLKKDKTSPDILVEAVADIRSPGYDLYHFPAFSLYQPGIPLNFPKPYVVTVHDVTRLEFAGHYPSGFRGRIRLWQQRAVLTRAAAVITDSYSSVRQITRYLPVLPSRIKMVYLAAPDIFRPQKQADAAERISRKYGLPRKFVLTNGDVDWNKNLTGFLSACQKTGIPAVVYGKSPRELIENPQNFNFRHGELSHLPHLREQLIRPGVKALGFVPDNDLVKIFNLATAYCQPSFAEGFGIPVLQALACGIPVACSRTHSLPEIAGEAAVYFDPESPDQISRALGEITTGEKIRSELIQKGFAQAKKFSWKKTAAETIMVYRNLIKSK